MTQRFSMHRSGLANRRLVVTCGAAAAVVMIGATAVAANMRIISSADNGEIGVLSAVADVGSATPGDDLAPEVLDQYRESVGLGGSPTIQEVSIGSSAPTAVVAAGEALTFAPAAVEGAEQRFNVGSVGTVVVSVTETSLRLVDVSAAKGWTVSVDTERVRTVVVGFSNGDRQVVFTAELNDDGSIDVEARELSGGSSGTAPSGSQPTGSTPSATAPASSTPGNGTSPSASSTAPSNTQPSNTTPSNTQPSNTTPSNTQPSNTTPSGSTPGTTVGSTPSSSVPSGSVTSTTEPDDDWDDDDDDDDDDDWDDDWDDDDDDDRDWDD